MKLIINEWMHLDLINAAYSVVIALMPNEWWIVYQTDDKAEAFRQAKEERKNATSGKVYVLDAVGRRVRF